MNKESDPLAELERLHEAATTALKELEAFDAEHHCPEPFTRAFDEEVELEKACDRAEAALFAAVKSQLGYLLKQARLAQTLTSLLCTEEGEDVVERAKALVDTGDPRWPTDDVAKQWYESIGLGWTDEREWESLSNDAKRCWRGAYQAAQAAYRNERRAGRAGREGRRAQKGPGRRRDEDSMSDEKVKSAEEPAIVAWMRGMIAAESVKLSRLERVTLLAYIDSLKANQAELERCKENLAAVLEDEESTRSEFNAAEVRIEELESQLAEVRERDEVHHDSADITLALTARIDGLEKELAAEREKGARLRSALEKYAPILAVVLRLRNVGSIAYESGDIYEAIDAVTGLRKNPELLVKLEGPARAFLESIDPAAKADEKKPDARTRCTCVTRAGSPHSQGCAALEWMNEQKKPDAPPVNDETSPPLTRAVFNRGKTLFGIVANDENATSGDHDAYIEWCMTHSHEIMIALEETIERREADARRAAGPVSDIVSFPALSVSATDEKLIDDMMHKAMEGREVRAIARRLTREELNLGLELRRQAEREYRFDSEKEHAAHYFTEWLMTHDAALLAAAERDLDRATIEPIGEKKASPPARPVKQEAVKAAGYAEVLK
jgi:hypothetical protein